MLKKNYFLPAILLMACCCFLSTLLSAQTINTIAGSGPTGNANGSYTGDGGPATAATLNHPEGVAIDASGNVYIIDFKNHCIRKITAGTGIISTITGTGVGGYSGDGGLASAAQLNFPNGITLDAAGNIYISDSGNHRVRKIEANTGIIHTIAGTGLQGYNGDGIPAIAAQVWYPVGLAVDSIGDVYVADQNNHRIRKIDTSTGVISTVAGTGTAGYNGDGIAATTAQLNYPNGVALDVAGNIYLTDGLNQRIREITVSTGLINTVAGTGTAGYNGDGIAAATAQLNFPDGVTVDAAGNIYTGEEFSYRVRKIDVNTAIINTIAGTGVWGFSGDGGAATAATLYYPGAIAIDTLSCNLYIADENNNRIRLITGLWGCTVQPIEWGSFTGRLIQSEKPSASPNGEVNVVLLNWSTATEINNDYFTIERSAHPNLLNWEAISQVKGAGNSNKTNDYQFTDNSLPTGEAQREATGFLYYRLKQVDYNGSFTYSKVISVKIEKSNSLKIGICPNPAADIITLEVGQNKRNMKIEIEIYDVPGRKIIQSEITNPKSVPSGKFQISISSLSKGIYFLKATNGVGQTQIKFVKE